LPALYLVFSKKDADKERGRTDEHSVHAANVDDYVEDVPEPARA